MNSPRRGADRRKKIRRLLWLNIHVLEPALRHHFLESRSIALLPQHILKMHRTGATADHLKEFPSGKIHYSIPKIAHIVLPQFRVFSHYYKLHCFYIIRLFDDAATAAVPVRLLFVSIFANVFRFIFIGKRLWHLAAMWPKWTECRRHR